MTEPAPSQGADERIAWLLEENSKLAAQALEATAAREQAEAACETEKSLRVKAQACLARMRGTDFWEAMPEDERRYWNAEIQSCLKGNDAPGKSTADELRRLRDENLKLRKILAHVPGRIGLKAKEDAGYGEQIHTKEQP